MLAQEANDMIYIQKLIFISVNYLILAITIICMNPYYVTYTTKHHIIS